MEISEVKMGGGYKLPLAGIPFSNQDSWVAVTVTGEESKEELKAKAKEVSDELTKLLRELLEGESSGVIEELVTKKLAEREKEWNAKLELARSEYKKLLAENNKLKGK